MMDFIAELGMLALGSRLKRLSDDVLQQGEEVYEALNIQFEPRWFAIVYLLKSERRPLSITEIADNLGLTHPAVIKTVRSMVKKGIVTSRKDRNDARRHLVRLSRKGQAMLPVLEPVWEDFRAATRELFGEIDVDVISVIEKLEKGLARRSLGERIVGRAKRRQYEEVEVIEYTPEWREAFEKLNCEWLTRYFEVEPEDRRLLMDPEREILGKGGTVLFARLGGTVVGTIAVMNHGGGVFELTKMAVTESAQGRQVGKRLAHAGIDRARDAGGRIAALRTDPRLQAAVQLYRSLGFELARDDLLEPDGTKRSERGFTMKLDLAAAPRADRVSR
jgi:DNA-binding MarR family transcriptional regulator/GNAT superfamily N-acetyltransferase